MSRRFIDIRGEIRMAGEGKKGDGKRGKETKEYIRNSQSRACTVDWRGQAHVTLKQDLHSVEMYVSDRHVPFSDNVMAIIKCLKVTLQSFAHAPKTIVTLSL